VTVLVRIDPDGTVTRLAGSNLLDQGHIACGGALEFLALRAPEPLGPGGGLLMGAIADRGALDGLPLNVKAWTLYGRSPVCGPMIVGYDSEQEPRQTLPDEWIERVSRDDFVPDDIRRLLRVALQQCVDAGEVITVTYPI
jgi:hypothetical protein